MMPAMACPGSPKLRPMTLAHVDAVHAIEAAAYPFPWSRGNFVDSIVAGHTARILVDADGALAGYYIAMAGVEEMHLLNITVAPVLQGRGRASAMFADLRGECLRHQARSLWLEVRVGNQRARSIYRHLGFVEVGVRRAYYPAGGGREDAIVMSLALAERGQRCDATD